MSDIRTKPATTEYRDGWERIFDVEASPLRAYRVTLAEKDPPPERDGISYVVVLHRASRSEVAQTWKDSPLVATKIEEAE